MQLQLGLAAHSASQLQALAFSSQYQPAGQMPLPHGVQVPSSQRGPAGAGSGSSLAGRSVSLATDSLSARRTGSSAADFGAGSAAPPPQADRSVSQARQR